MTIGSPAAPSWSTKPSAPSPRSCCRVALCFCITSQMISKKTHIEANTTQVKNAGTYVSIRQRSWKRRCLRCRMVDRRWARLTAWNTQGGTGARPLLPQTFYKTKSVPCTNIVVSTCDPGQARVACLAGLMHPVAHHGKILRSLRADGSLPCSPLQCTSRACFAPGSCA